MKLTAIFVLFICCLTLTGQYSPAAGTAGSSAIHFSSPLFKSWAKGCTVSRGFIDMTDTTFTFSQAGTTSNRAFYGEPADAVGVADGLSCVSLGDRGIAVCSFALPVINGPGFDFAVFENGMKSQQYPYLWFLELAVVEVSSDSVHFVRFPSSSLTSFDEQISGFGQLDPVKINNLAGKYIAGYGTPFDLEELKDCTAVDVNNIRFIRVIDAVGSVDSLFATYDSEQRPINDPFPTPFWQGGFDLDGIGVINQLTQVPLIHEGNTDELLVLFPNPVRHGMRLFLNHASDARIVCITDISGHAVPPFTFGEEVNYTPGIYFVHIELNKKLFIRKLIVAD